jgi:hypothetical protein
MEEAIVEIGDFVARIGVHLNCYRQVLWSYND